MTREINLHPSHVQVELVPSQETPLLGQERKGHLYTQGLVRKKISYFSLSDGLSKERNEKLKQLDQEVQTLWNLAKNLAEQEALSKGISYSRCEVSLTRREIIYFDTRGERYLVTNSLKNQEIEKGLSLFFSRTTSLLLLSQNLLFSHDPERASHFGSRAFFQTSGERWHLFSTHLHSVEDYEEKVFPLLSAYLTTPEKITKARAAIEEIKGFLTAFEEKIDLEIQELTSKVPLNLKEKELFKKRREQKEKLLGLHYDALLSVGAIASVYASEKGLFSESLRSEIYHWMHYYLSTARKEPSFMESMQKGSQGIFEYLLGKGPQDNVDHQRVMLESYAHQAANLATIVEEGGEISFERQLLEWINGPGSLDERVLSALS